MKKHINALLGFVCYTIGVIAAAYYGLWKMLVLPLHTLAVSFLAGDLNVTLLAVCVVKILFSTTMAGLIWCIGYIAYNHFKGTQDPDWETMEKEYMAGTGFEAAALAAPADHLVVEQREMPNSPENPDRP